MQSGRGLTYQCSVAKVEGLGRLQAKVFFWVMKCNFLQVE